MACIHVICNFLLIIRIVRRLPKAIHIHENIPILLEGIFNNIYSSKLMHSIALTIKINPDKRTEYLEATKLHIQNSKNERGCILFEVFESHVEPNTFLYMEAYKSREDFEFHSDQMYLAQYQAKLNSMLVKPVKSSISRYSPI